MITRNINLGGYCFTREEPEDTNVTKVRITYRDHLAAGDYNRPVSLENYSGLWWIIDMPTFTPETLWDIVKAEPHRTEPAATSS